MEVVGFQEVRDLIISNMARKMLIPIIGSGFTRGCSALRGTVPSGKEYKEYMVDMILSHVTLTEDEKNSLTGTSFSDVADYYHTVISEGERRTYLREHFLNVILDNVKCDFLSLPWPYVYTLNIDDGIENNSEYKNVIYSNRKTDLRIFDEKKCIIKLHGDIKDMLNYLDSESEIFGKRQYLKSLQKNQVLLSKFNHDQTYNNLIFIGCSLDDEIDLLAYSEKIEHDISTSKYICMTQVPGVLERIKLERYGITHCIVFESFDNIYTKLYEAGIDAQKISVDDLARYKKLSFCTIDENYEKNKEFLFFGKSLINHDHMVSFPHFFISREVTASIISKMNTYCVEIIIGSRCSGKTYILMDIARRIKNRDVFFFETKDRLSDAAFKNLISKTNCVILADASALTVAQIEEIFNNLCLFIENKVNIIITGNKSDRDLNGKLKLFRLDNRISDSNVFEMEIDNYFTKKELIQLNPLLTSIGISLFSEDKTIVDNIIETSVNLSKKNKYQGLIPNLSSIRELASLIALATERKLFSTRVMELDIYNELFHQVRKVEPLIDIEATWSFEISPKDNSPQKYVVNADSWLCYQLEKYASDKKNYHVIVDAYLYLVRRIIEQEGRPDLLDGTRSISYRDYILFDNINRIFCSNKSSGQIGILLINQIYEKLNHDLSVDPNYMHQRAKCYIKLCYYERNIKEKIQYLEKAYRAANVAESIFQERYKQCGNNKLLISIAHIVYTRALILCHKCSINEYNNTIDNSMAIRTLFEALLSPFNSYDFAKKDSFNYNNAIDKIIQKITINPSIIEPEARHLVEELLTFIMNTRDSDNKYISY